MVTKILPFFLYYPTSYITLLFILPYFLYCPTFYITLLFILPCFLYYPTLYITLLFILNSLSYFLYYPTLYITLLFILNSIRITALLGIKPTSDAKLHTSTDVIDSMSCKLYCCYYNDLLALKMLLQ